MLFALIPVALLVTGARAAVPEGCVWTDTNCACSLKKDIVQSQVCWDAVQPLVPMGEDQPCRSRECNISGKKESYVCDCNGDSYCGFQAVEKISLVPSSPGMCTRQRAFAKSVFLVADDIKNVTGLPWSQKKCIFSDAECTCMSARGKNDCIDFLKNDPDLGNICQVRDCKDSMTCDCAGNETCSKDVVTKMVWVSTGNVPGKPGTITCKQQEATFLQVARKQDQPAHGERED
jgi:hypothetical protein